MAEFVRFTLDDGSQVLFESAESDLVALHGGGEPDVRDGGRLTARRTIHQARLMLHGARQENLPA